MNNIDQLKRLSRIAASKCFVNDPAIGRDDLEQTAVVALLRNPELKPAFAVIRARGAISDLRRSNQVKRRRQQITLSSDYQIANGDDPVTMVADAEQRDLIRNSECLTKQQKLIVGLLLDGFTQAEISKQTGISLSGISNQVSAAIRRLREQFGLPAGGSVRMGRGKAASGVKANEQH